MTARELEQKWQKRWEETGLYKFKKENVDKKYYVMEMFSYPSGAKLHIGHWYNYGPSDSFARFKRMQGYEVFQPQGFDAFGLPAENYAIKTGIHPMDSTLKNIATMEEQLKRMGATFDWDAEVKTCMPDYYRWTQWCFLQLFKHGLAYRKEAPVNWCTGCNTVLANEQVIDGECERCSMPVVRKNLTQWFFKITQYAEELLSGLETIDWPEKTKIMQRNWIGKSVGGEVTFTVDGSGEPFTVFTTRADTLYGCTYVVFSPENKMVDSLTTDAQRKDVEAYKAYAAQATEIDRLSSTREKTGAFTGSYAINPINGRRVPIYIADYVLASYGTGIVMAVPAHDERDYDFAKKYDLPIERVIKSADGSLADTSACELPYTEYGVLCNSGAHDGLTTEEGKKAILSLLDSQGKGGFKVNYRLRDWLISRQRYWGAPIPVVHCEKCGIVPIPEKDLPVLLPYDVDFTPDGTSPLLKHAGFMNATCPQCGGPAKRDADTMDTFVCSSWYFLRYPDSKNENEAFNREKIDSMLPVDKYIGGAEHACMHLLYARFFVKALRDMGYLDFDEPFKSLVHQGTILGPDGNKMSKSRGNVVSPDDLISQYGSDTFRMYLMFGFSYTEGGIWNDDGIKSVARFLDRVERMAERSKELRGSKGALGAGAISPREKELNFVRHSAIKSISSDLERFQFNTAIARMMELVNALYNYVNAGDVNGKFLEETVRDLLLLLAPFAPHITEELWERMGYKYSIFNQAWPAFDESALQKDVIEYGVQVNGKVRCRVEIAADADQAAIQSAVLKDADVLKYIDGKEVRKVIVVRNIVNIVVA